MRTSTVPCKKSCMSVKYCVFNTSLALYDVTCIANAAAILRKVLTANEQWNFTGSGSPMDFQPPPKLASFLRWLLMGTKSKDVKGKRDVASKNLVNLVAQQIVHNFRTDRQTSYQPVSDTGFRKRSDTALSIGLALPVHKKILK